MPPAAIRSYPAMVRKIMSAWGANAATKLFKVMDNLDHILAIELMNAAQRNGVPPSGQDFTCPSKNS